jgi:hypothetical protein
MHKRINRVLTFAAMAFLVKDLDANEGWIFGEFNANIKNKEINFIPLFKN